MSRRSSFVIVLAVIGLASFLAIGFSDGLSARFNYPWALQYKDAFSLSTILPKHLPGLWSGLGGYDFFFYAPIPFWTMAAIASPVCIGCSIETEFTLSVAIFWLASGVTFHIFLRRYFDAKASLLGSVVYLLLPYHLWIDWYIRQAVGEIAAYTFLPLVAYGFDAIRQNEKHRWTLAIGIAGVLLSHLPTALLAAHVFAVLMIATIVQMRLRNENVMRFALSLIGWSLLGAMLSCFYWLPAISLIDAVSSKALYSELFVAEHWLFGSGRTAPQPAMAKFMLFSFLIVLPTILVSLKFARGPLLLWIAVPFAFTLFMNSEASTLIWRHWVLSKVQFPWRLMAFADISAAVGFAVVITELSAVHRFRVLCIFFYLAAYPALKVILAAVGVMLLEYDTQQQHAGAMEYLSPEMHSALEYRLGEKINHHQKPETISEQIVAIVHEVKANLPSSVTSDVASRRITYQIAANVQKFTAPVQYWSFWRAELDDGTPVKLTANTEFGTIDIWAPDDGFQGRSIILTLPYQPSEKLGIVVSLLALSLFALFWRRTRKAERSLGQI